MYKLPAKFTGYNAEKIRVERFTLLCYSLQGLGLIKVLEVQGYDYPQNYYSALVEDCKGQFTLYMNCYTGVFCFGHITRKKQQYLSRTKLESSLKELYPEAVVLTESDLHKTITSEHMLNLNPMERKELNHWLPCTVGKAMFSWYFD